MKARVKATGEIIEVNRDSSSEYFDYLDVNSRILYKTEALEFIEEDFDYWTRLEHQAAIGAMQGLCANPQYPDKSWEAMAADAATAAHALVEKYKNEKRSC